MNPMNNTFPVRINGLLVYSAYRSKKRSFFSYKCECGRYGKIRSDTIDSLKTNGCGRCFNKFHDDGTKCVIDVSTELNNNAHLIIDSDRIDEVMSFVHGKIWAIRSSSKRTMYAECKSSINVSNLFHRSLFNLNNDFVVDHIDGNGLNCLRSNVRIVKKSENNRNLPKFKTNTTGVTGVSRFGSGYRSYIWSKSRQVSLGCHGCFLDAVSARKSAELIYGYHDNHGRQKNENEEIEQ